MSKRLKAVQLGFTFEEFKIFVSDNKEQFNTIIWYVYFNPHCIDSVDIDNIPSSYIFSDGIKKSYDLIIKGTLTKYLELNGMDYQLIETTHDLATINFKKYLIYIMIFAYNSNEWQHYTPTLTKSELAWIEKDREVFKLLKADENKKRGGR